VICLDSIAGTIESTHTDKPTRIRAWAHEKMDRYLNIPSILLLSLIPAAIAGTIMGVNEHNLAHDPPAHPCARIWAKTFENTAFLAGIVYIIASGIAARWRMNAEGEGRRMCSGRDIRVFVQDLLFMLVVNVVFSFYRMALNWAFGCVL
jgi:hypothetical protein